MDKLLVIVDLQFGSTGKGLLAGYLANNEKPDTVIAAWAPNAGHTFIDGSGNKYINIALPNGIVSPNLRRVLIGPGATINPETLMDEMERYHRHLHGVTVLIHEHAAVVREEHRQMESGGMVGIGSTMKGVGEAAIEKLRRKTDGAANIARYMLANTPLEGFVVNAETYNNAVDAARVILVEGAQGFSLGINSGYYPYVTSRECTTAQLLSDCAIPVQRPLGERMRVYGAARTFPIRVANRYDTSGNLIGYSGPCYPDQHEMAWRDIGVEPELTTVTKLPRRLFSFSHEQLRQAVRMNGVNEVFLNFVNYLPPKRVDDFIKIVNFSIGGTIRRGGVPYVSLLGRGPTINDIERIAR